MYYCIIPNELTFKIKYPNYTVSMAYLIKSMQCKLRYYLALRCLVYILYHCFRLYRNFINIQYRRYVILKQQCL
jgi:hypothetical protein